MAKSCIPGYDEALGIERKLREEAFLADTVSIADIAINHVTPFLLARLFRMRTPFLTGGDYSPSETVRFLWALSPDFTANNEARETFIESTIKRLAEIGFDVAEDEIDEFLDATFLDAPECGAESVPMVSSIAWLVTQMAMEPFSWDEQRTLHSPLRRIYQYIKCVRRSKGEVLHNAISDPLKEQWLADFRAGNIGGQN